MSARDEIDDAADLYETGSMSLQERANEIDAGNSSADFDGGANLAMLAAVTERRLGLSCHMQTINADGRGWEKLLLSSATCEVTITPELSGPDWEIRPTGITHPEFEEAYVAALGILVGAEIGLWKERREQRERAAAQGKRSQSATWKNSTAP